MNNHAQTDLLLADEALVSIEAVSALMGLPRSTCYALARNGTIPSFRIGRAVRFKVSEVKAWLAEQHTQ